MSRMLGVSLAVFTALGGLSAAARAGDMIRQDVSVSYGDLDIQSESGARALLARIDHAAKMACGVAPQFNYNYSIAPLLAQKVFAECHNDAVGRAVASLNSPILREIYARNGEQYTLRVAGR